MMIQRKARFFLTGFALICMMAGSAQAAIEVAEAYSYETADSQKVGMAALEIKNTGEQDEMLVFASSSGVCDHVEIHQMSEESGIMKMRRVENLLIPAGETVTLSPMGYHLMLMGLVKPLESGQEFDLNLEFLSGQKIDLPVLVKSRVKK